MTTHVRTAGILLLFTLFLVSACSPNKSSPTGSIAELVRGEYSGESAIETVAFLDNHVRWPGNQGFNESIAHIVSRLEKAGFVSEETATADDRMTFRLEHYPMNRPAWQPKGASVHIVGVDEPVLTFENNRNMLATYSYSTPPEGVTGRLVDGGDGSSEVLAGLNLKGAIVLVEGQISRAFQRAVVEGGALGILAYSLPDYLQPEKNKHSIQFRSIPNNSEAQSWGIALSKNALETLRTALQAGPVELHVTSEVVWTENAVEQTVVADIRGSQTPDERFVFSAHVQEPGANDNASGVGAQVEMARVAASLVQAEKMDPKRTITFIWGDEIRSTGRYVSQDSVRKEGILWGLSLDMVGEDTQKTGGTFLIEKMPDPSAIWTRGEEKHSEWGGSPLSKEDMRPHYFNDIVYNRAMEQSATNGWVVKTNPYEGGSDHVPFLNADIPGLLLWHFTDQFYHTDRDRIEMVSADELKNVGVTALVTALGLVTADQEMTQLFVYEVLKAAQDRLQVEFQLGQAAIQNGADPAVEKDILDTWASWYDKALASMIDIEVGGTSTATFDVVRAAQQELQASLQKLQFSGPSTN